MLLVDVDQSERVQGAEIIRVAADERLAQLARAIDLPLHAQRFRLLELLEGVAQGFGYVSKSRKFQRNFLGWPISL